MASKITEVAPVTREVEIEGYPFHLTFSAEGITVVKKGSRGANKPTMKVPWTAVLELGAEKQLPPKPDGSAASAYEFFSID